MRILLIIAFVFSFVFLKLQGQTAPEIGTITQPTCSFPTGSVVLNGLPTGDWTLTRSPDGIITNGTGITTIITGLPPGVSYTFTVTTTEGTSPASNPAVINLAPVPPPSPEVSITEQPTCFVATGTIAVTSPIGPEFQYNIDGGAYQSSTIFTGILPGNHNILVRSVSDNTCISNPSSVIINPQPVTPSAPTASTITQPTCSVSTGSVVLNGLPPTGTWTLTITPGGTITGTGTSTTVSGLSPDTYSFSVTNEAGCTSLPLNGVVINSQPSAPVAASVSVVQPTCAVATGTITVTAPLGEYQYNIDGGTYQTSPIFPNVSPGNHNITVRRSDDFTCVSSPASAVINPQPVTPSPPLLGSVIQPTCAVATGTIILNGLPSTGTWTLTRTPGGATTGSGSSITVTGLSANTYSFTVTNEAGCTSLTLSNIVINPQPSSPDAASVSIVHPTCAVATGTISVTAPLGTYEYNIDGGLYQTSTNFTGVSPGLHSILVRRSTDNTCISTPIVVTVNPQPSPPQAANLTITQPTCTIGTGIIVITSPLGNYQYNIDGGTFQTSVTFTGVAPGDHNIRVRSSIDNTCVSVPAPARINAQPVTPAAPILVSVTQPTCTVATGSISLNGLPSSGTWTLTRTPGGPVTGSGASITITGLSPNTYSFTVTNESGCTSLPLNNVVINPQPVTPSIPTVGTVTQPSCTVSTGSVVLNGLPSTGTWTLTRTPGGTTYSGSGTTTTISGLAADSYTFTVTNASGCTSPPTANITITPQPVTPSPPSIGTITNPDCNVPTGSVVINDLPASGTWTLTRNPGGTSTSSTGTTITLYGIPPGSYTYTVSNASGCISAPSANIVINTGPVTPTAPGVETIIQPTCTVETGSVTLNGLPSTGSWTLIRNPGNTSMTGTGTRITISGLMPNNYTFRVTNEAGCTSPVSVNAIINPQPITPQPPVIGPVNHPSCTNATGSVVLTGLPSSASWTIIRTPGTISYAGSGSSITISGLSSNTYRFTVTNESGCISAPSDNVTINPQPPIPVAPVIGNITQPTCTFATGNVILSGLPSTGTWTLTRNPGGAIYTGTGNSFTVSGLTPNRYTFTVTNSYGCLSSSSSDVVINPQPLTPSAPTILSITQPVETVLTGSVVISGLPSSGTWILTRNPGGNTITGNGTRTTISGLPAGSYTFTVTNSSGCISPPSSIVGIYTLKAIGPGDKILHQNDTIKIENSEAGSLFIKIESNAEWSVSENSLWIKTEKEPNSSVIKVTYLENISVSDKTAPIRIKYSLNPDIVLNINQKGRISQIKDSKLEFTRIYPNPAKTLLFIDLPEEEFNILRIAVTNKLGNTVIDKKYYGLKSGSIIEMNISGLPYGQYFVTLSDDMAHKTLTLIKQ